MRVGPDLDAGLSAILQKSENLNENRGLNCGFGASPDC
jgi:hypothetical protein